MIINHQYCCEIHKGGRPTDLMYPIHFAQVMEKWRPFARHGHKQSAEVHRMKVHLKKFATSISVVLLLEVKVK